MAKFFGKKDKKSDKKAAVDSIKEEAAPVEVTVEVTEVAPVEDITETIEEPPVEEAPVDAYDKFPPSGRYSWKQRLAMKRAEKQTRNIARQNRQAANG